MKYIGAPCWGWRTYKHQYRGSTWSEIDLRPFDADGKRIEPVKRTIGFRPIKVENKEDNGPVT